MNKFRLIALTLVLALILPLGVVSAQDGPVTLRVLIHQNPPMVEFIEEFNARFTEANPNITVDLSVVNANDLATVTQTRLSAGDIDVIDIFGFSNSVQPYMSGATPPNWQVMIEAGLLLDLTDQPFLANYDPVSIQDSGMYNDTVYAINLGRVVYSGIYYNKDMFTEFGVEIPTTWDELVAACEVFTAEGIGCMTAGGADGWPIFVGAYGLLGSLFPDQAAYVEGLWTGDIKFNDEQSMVMWERMQIYARDMMERGASGIPGDAAPGRFASGAVAMFPGGSWYASAIESAEPDFDWGYIPFPGSDVVEDNQGWFGKYDQGWAIAAGSPNVEAALLYLEAFSEPENYQAFVDAVGFIPTQPTATLNTKIGGEIAQYLDNFRVGYEQYWVAPTGVGQWASPFASFFAPFNEWDDAAALADRAQSDLQSGLDEVSGS
ncbi:MAG TPA: extracellular solute-binding protein [Aggregatilineales bacterium]|nr:extracellular solute-binding protein [Aggregatilineales bacterium]